MWGFDPEDKFYQQQLALLKLIKEYGPDLKEIFRGLTLTPETTMQELVDTTATVIEEMAKKMRGGSQSES